MHKIIGLAGSVLLLLTGPTVSATVTSAEDLAAAVFRAQDAASASRVHAAWGTYVKSVEQDGVAPVDGMIATQSVYPDLRLTQPGEVLYAPTMKPPNYPCIEMTTSYKGGQAPQVFAWDWCRGTSIEDTGVGRSVTVDGTFMNTYTTTVNGHPAYKVLLRRSGENNQWTSSLWNYTTGTWDPFFTSSGKGHSKSSKGWDFFEIYSNPTSSGLGSYCAQAAGRTFEATGIQLLVNGNWVAASADNSTAGPVNDPSQFQCPGIKFQMVTQYDHWTTRTGPC